MIIESDKYPTMRTALKAVGAGLFITIVVFGGTTLLLLAVPSLKQWAATFIVAAVAIHAILMLSAIWHFLRRNNISLVDIGFSRPTWRLLHLLWQVPTIVIAVIMAQLLMFVISGNDPGNNSAGVEALADLISKPLVVLLFVVVVLLVPLWEEVFFRGIIQGAVRVRFGVLAGVAASALVFAAAHGALVLIPYMITLGCGLALLREFHRNLWGPLVMHCTLNLLASSVMLTALF